MDRVRSSLCHHILLQLYNHPQSCWMLWVLLLPTLTVILLLISLDVAGMM